MAGTCSGENWHGKLAECESSCVHSSLLRLAPYYALWYPGPLANPTPTPTLTLTRTLTLTLTLTRLELHRDLLVWFDPTAEPGGSAQGTLALLPTTSVEAHAI